MVMSLGREFLSRYTLPNLLGEECFEVPRIFLGDGVEFDLSDVRFLHIGLDTVRQLYTGYLRDATLQQIDDAYSEGPNSIIELGGHEWVVGSGGRSRYKYLLRNLEFGATVLVKSHHVKADSKGSHVKVQLSPKLLIGRSDGEIQGLLDGVAGVLLEQMEPSGCQVHMCADIQGWSPPVDFEHRLVTRSRQQHVNSGISSIEVVGADVCQVYGNRQSFLFGKANSVQFAAYRKDLAAHHFKNFEFWEQVWSQAHDVDGVVMYESGAPVWRLEFRFHQSVLKQIGAGLGKLFHRFFDVAQYLTSIWKYALGTFRLDADDRYIDPLWQLLYEDIDFGSKHKAVEIKRVYPNPSGSLARNVDYAIGNMLSVFARHNLSTGKAIKFIMRSGLWLDFCEIQINRGNDPQAFIEKNLSLRRLNGMAA